MVSILKTKLHRPQVTAEHLLRKDLIDKIEDNLMKPLTLVSAGAGYGKTMLVSTWLENTKRTYAWISISEDDNDIRTFLNYIYSSINSVFPKALQQFKALLTAAKLPPIKEVAHLLINDIEGLGKDFILVLDDYHLIKNEEINSLLNEVLRFPPEHLHLVIITREDPSLRLIDLRVHGRLTEIRMKDLSFTNNEITDLFRKLNGIHLKDQTVFELSSRTEGWVTGLKLISLAYGDSQNEESLRKGLSKRNIWANEFLFEEVFNKQEKQIQDMLLCSALFDRFSMELMDYVLGDELCFPEDNFVLWLEQHNMFVIPLDRELQWVRYHHFFHELLKKEVTKRLSKERCNSYHQRASDWFLNQGQIEEAISHAILSDNPEGAVQIVEQFRQRELEQDRWFELEKWLKIIPTEFHENNPVIHLTKAWICFQQTRIHKVLELIDAFSEEFEVSELNKSLQGELYFFIGMLRYFSGEGAESSAYLQKSVKYLKGFTGLVLGEAELMYALSLQMVGKRMEALKLLEECIETSRSTDIMYLTRIQTGINYILILEADFTGARRWSKPMKKVMTKSESEYALSWGEYLNGFVRLSLFNLKTALDEFTSATKRKYISDMSISVNAYIGAILCLEFMNKSEEARDVLLELERFVRGIDDSEFLPMVPSCRARLQLLQGNVDKALEWARSDQHSIDALSIFLWVEVPVITQARVLVNHGDIKEIQYAIALLKQICQVIKNVHFQCQIADPLILLSIAYQKLKKKKEALATLKEVVLLAKEQKWIRPFVEASGLITPLLIELRDNAVAPNFIEVLLLEIKKRQSKESNGLMVGNNKGNKGSRVRKSDSLTLREIETIQWLSKGLRNQEIADKMFVSLDTIKKHLYRSFQKLGVKSRLELIDKAHRLNLIQDSTE